MFLKEHFNRQECTYTSASKSGHAQHTKGLICAGELDLNLFSCVHHQANQLFHLTVCTRWIHAGQLEALPISDARVADDREATIEQALSKIGIDAI
jgi:hypothetical protein